MLECLKAAIAKFDVSSRSKLPFDFR